MGAYLSAPITTKESDEGSNNVFEYGVAAMQGWRTDMEDAHSIQLELNDDSADGPTGMFAIFDGHGGKEVAKFVANHLHNHLVQLDSYKAGELDKALVESFLLMDEIILLNEHKAELKALKGTDEESGRQDRDNGGIVVDSSQLPESLLEVLGMPSANGFQIRLIRSGPNGRMQIDDIVKDGEEEERAADDAPAAIENAQQVQVHEIVEGDSDRDSKRLRVGGAMEVDTSGAPADPEVDEDGVIQVEELSTPRSDEEWGGPSAGCTAVCAVVRGKQLVVANAGDSRCVLSRNGTAVPLTSDHKPMDPEEYSRIIKAGGFVAEGRVNGSLNLSRALGDLEYKQNKELPPAEQMVTALPDISTETLQAGDEFLFLACDGIWDVLTCQEAVTFVRDRLIAGKKPKQICEEICDHCLAPDTSGCGKGCDNMSVAVIVLKPFADPKIVAKD